MIISKRPKEVKERGNRERERERERDYNARFAFWFSRTAEFLAKGKRAPCKIERYRKKKRERIRTRRKFARSENRLVFVATHTRAQEPALKTKYKKHGYAM